MELKTSSCNLSETRETLQLWHSLGMETRWRLFFSLEQNIILIESQEQTQSGRCQGPQRQVKKGKKNCMNLKCNSFLNSQFLEWPRGRPFWGALMGQNKQQKKCSLATSALRAHGGSGRLEGASSLRPQPERQSRKWNRRNVHLVTCGRKGSERALRKLESNSAGFCLETLIFAAAAGKAFCASQRNNRVVTWNQIWCNWKKFRIFIYWTKWPSLQWYRNYNPCKPPRHKCGLWTVNKTRTRLDVCLSLREAPRCLIRKSIFS